MRRPANPGGLMLLVLLLTRAWQQLRQQYGYHVRFPIVTCSLVVACVVIHTHPNLVHPTLSRIIPCDHISDVCIQPGAIWSDPSQWYRLISSAFFHLNDTHLYYNMLALLYKGFLIESGSQYAMSSVGFGTLCLGLTTLSHSLMVVFAYIMARYFGRYHEWDGCAVGASALLFALKTVVNLDHRYNQQTHENIYGFLIPMRWAAWVELALVQLMVPQASLNGHVAGIVAGLMYVYGWRGQRAAIPDKVRALFAPIFALLPGRRRDRGAAGGAAAPGYGGYGGSFGSGVVGGRVARPPPSASAPAAYDEQVDEPRSVPVRPAPSAPPQNGRPARRSPSPSPAPSPPASSMFTLRMKQLYDMGYHDRAANHRALVRADGDVGRAVELLQS